MNEEKLMSLSDISRLTGKDFKAIKRKITGMSPEKIEGKKHLYFVPDVLSRLYADDKTEDLNLTLERAKLARVQRKKAEIELAEMGGKLKPVELIIFEYQKMVLALRAKLLAIPNKLSLELAEINNPREIQPIIKEEIYTALDELASEGFSAGIGIDVKKALKEHRVEFDF